jgi:hypothetical protein
MPALFAYLIAVGLLLGGGYGALTWLAAPEPVKVVARAKPIPRPHLDDANRETASELGRQEVQQEPQKASPETIGRRDPVAVSSNQPSVAPPVEASTASAAQGAPPVAAVPTQMAHAEVSAQAPVQQNPAVNAEVASTQTAPPPEPAQPASTGSLTTAASPTPLATAKTVKKRPHHQRLASRSEKTALVPMTLRTIEFPDGRRVTQLLPYRSDDRD